MKSGKSTFLLPRRQEGMFSKISIKNLTTIKYLRKF